MDSTVAFALMAKAQMVFGADDTFLSFPLATPYAYKPEELEFMSGEAAEQRVGVLREYSHMVDPLQRGARWNATDYGTLSDVYADVLTTAKLALSTRTAQEQAEYDRATAFLYTRAADGSRSDSPSLVRYRQFRDALYSLQENYNNKKIDATYCTDPAVRERWERVEEPCLRRQIDELRSDWSSGGFRVEVEKARQVEETLGAKSPALLWAEWSKQCNPDIDRVTDPATRESFYPSGFAPVNVVDTSAWLRFTLTGDEVSALVNQAPSELARLAADQADLDIESLSFEFCSVRVERTWFVPKVLEARFWVFPDATRKISGGTADTFGFVAALVFARRLQIRLKQQSNRNSEILQRLARAETLSIGSFRIMQARAGATEPTALVLRAAMPPRPRLRPANRAVPIMAARPVMRRELGDLRIQPVAAAAVSTGAAVAIPARPLLRLQSRSFVRIPLASRPSAPPSSSPPNVTQNGDEIYIMAFICKRLPVCPNPDTTLQW